jgi:hypothetical protein
MVDRPRRRKDGGPGPIGRTPVLDDTIVRRSSHRSDRPGDLPAERMLPEQQLVEHREHVVRRRVDVHPDLVHDHRLLRPQIRGTKERSQGQLVHRLERHVPVGGRNLRAEDRQLTIGAGVHAAADALDPLRERAGLRVAARPLEHQVLEQV